MKPYLKYILLSASLIIAGIIISESMNNIANRFITTYNTNQFNSPAHIIAGGSKTGWSMDTYEQNFDANQTFTYSLDSTSTLRVWKNGKVSQYSGKNLKAVYYHMGQMLFISYFDEQGQKHNHFFNQPDKWE